MKCVYKVFYQRTRMINAIYIRSNNNLAFIYLLIHQFLYSLTQNKILNVNISYYTLIILFTYRTSVLRNKFCVLKISYIPNMVGHQAEQRIQELSTCILLHFIFYYPSIFMYLEITTKPFTRLIVIILHNTWLR